MKVIMPIRILISSMTMIFLVVVPRILIYFGLDFGALNDLVSPWATFLLIMFIAGFIVFPLLKNIRFVIPAAVVMVIGAVAMTFYLCNL